MLSDSTIRVVARAIALPDKVEELKAVLLSLLEPTDAEVGCIQYELLHNSSDPTDFTFVEIWKSHEHLDIHLASPHIQAALAQLDGLLAEPPDIRRYTVLG